MRKLSCSSVKVSYPRWTRQTIIDQLRQRIGRLREQLPVTRVVLFGSYVTGKQTAASDVDLLVVYSGEPRENAFALTKRILNIPRLEPHLYTEREYEQVRSVVDRMIAHGITVETEDGTPA